MTRTFSDVLPSDVGFLCAFFAGAVVLTAVPALCGAGLEASSQQIRVLLEWLNTGVSCQSVERGVMAGMPGVSNNREKNALNHSIDGGLSITTQPMIIATTKRSKTIIINLHVIDF
nr:hypothetical protein [Acetobacter persici]